MTAAATEFKVNPWPLRASPVAVWPTTQRAARAVKIPLARKPKIFVAMTLMPEDRAARSLPHEKILDCYYRPEENRGALEMILAESYAVRKK